MQLSILSATLKAVPSHRERPQTRASLVQNISQSLAISHERADAALLVTLELLRLFDLIQESDDYVVLSGQVQTYCHNSLAWYLENGQEILSNWNRHGTAHEDISLINLLEQAPYFLKSLEERRRELSVQKNLPLVAAREQPCSVVLFKAVHDGQTYLLHQWDQKAERYQLIGGTQRSAEAPEQTATREALEEVAQAHLVVGKSLFISRSALDPIEEWDVSRTYGALTHYMITVFQATLVAPEFATSESDLWISLQEIVAGRTHLNAQIASLGSTITKLRPGFLESLPASMDFKQTLRLSVPVAPKQAPPDHDSEPDIPVHLSLGWLWRLLKRLALHELALLLGVAFTVIGVAFSLGRHYEAQFGSSLKSPKEPSEASVRPTPQAAPALLPPVQKQ